MEARLRRPDWFAIYAAVIVLPCLLYAIFGSTVALGLLAPIAIGGYFILEWSTDNREARIFYDVDDDEIVRRIWLANGLGEQLSRCAALWHIYHAEGTRDWKRNAGASTLIKRTPIRAREGSLPTIRLNVVPWSVAVGPQKLLFLPDRLIVWDGKALAGVPYEALVCEVQHTRFIEDGTVPSDAPRLGTTWRFVRKDGGPDGRFKDNPTLPILGYGELNLSTATGLRVVLQSSNPQAVHGAAAVLQELARSHKATKRNAALDEAPTSAAAMAPPIAAQTAMATSNPPATNEGELVAHLATLFHYVAAADRRISEEEVSFIESALRRFAPAGSGAQPFVSRTVTVDYGRVSAAADALKTQHQEIRRWLLTQLEDLTAVDGRITPKEKERLSELRLLLDSRA